MEKFTLKPCIFFFNNQRKIGNIYVPENTNIYRGEEIFKKVFFRDIKYEDIDNYLINISENKEIVKKFDDLYDKVMKKNKLSSGGEFIFFLKYDKINI